MLKQKMVENKLRQEEKAKAKEELLAKKAEEKAQRLAEKQARKSSVEKVKSPKVPKRSPEEIAERKQAIQERIKMIWPIFSEKLDKKALRQEIKVELDKNLPVQETIRRLLQAGSQA